ncbi:MAG TPA: DtxR family transcriptional regulator [Kiritimatiellia bacterium]|jgi:DtxR family Mn-dependent transcriptional regulator|nr:DtxR family transcriptional regulator [Kiritimatiellia bacterium]HOE00645.1 DtxR family transcriptional regulator [Kiritimatiellia bacterium]HOE37174.1 DtxR family transcriptional regulator [Kiritimatiellia bacterium]HOR74586.1 DtxR family transcriptional regulator [Kiritimatiellia bacterium]HOU59131.1 DtxR family transcriptional regulator [Kiritimatiellia bacterium]
MKVERLSAKAEDYLETILRLSETPRGARTGDIAAELNVQPSTVSAALRSLMEQGLVDYTPYGAVGLTPKGRQVAEEISGRHVALRRFLTETLGLPPEDAEVAACGMEHDATPLVVERMGLLGDFLRDHPGMLAKWLALRETAKGERAPGVESGLDELPPGVRGVVMAVDVEGSLRKRLVEMGVTPGVLIAVERVAPLGDPIAVEVRGYRLSMRKAEAARIRVKWRPGLV